MKQLVIGKDKNNIERKRNPELCIVLAYGNGKFATSVIFNGEVGLSSTHDELLDFYKEDIRLAVTKAVSTVGIRKDFNLYAYYASSGVHRCLATMDGDTFFGSNPKWDRKVDVPNIVKNLFGTYWQVNYKKDEKDVIKQRPLKTVTL